MCGWIAPAGDAARLTSINRSTHSTHSTHSTIQTKTDLVVRVNLYFGDQDEVVEPVETDFYLLDDSLVNILKKAKFKPVYTDGKKHRLKEEDYLEAAAKILLSESNDEAGVLAFLINDAMMRHQIASAHTNVAGRGYFQAIKAGNYYLFGITKVDDQFVVWHLPVTVKSGSNSLELNQHNAAAIFSDDQ